MLERNGNIQTKIRQSAFFETTEITLGYVWIIFLFCNCTVWKYQLPFAKKEKRNWNSPSICQNNITTILESYTNTLTVYNMMKELADFFSLLSFCKPWRLPLKQHFFLKHSTTGQNILSNFVNFGAQRDQK